jgi:hypothetical protein
VIEIDPSRGYATQDVLDQDVPRLLAPTGSLADSFTAYPGAARSQVLNFRRVAPDDDRFDRPQRGLPGVVVLVSDAVVSDRSPTR